MVSGAINGFVGNTVDAFANGRILITKNFGYSDTDGDWQKCQYNGLSQYQMIFSKRRCFMGQKTVNVADCHSNHCHCSRSSLYSVTLTGNTFHVACFVCFPPSAVRAQLSLRLGVETEHRLLLTCEFDGMEAKGASGHAPSSYHVEIK